MEQEVAKTLNYIGINKNNYYQYDIYKILSNQDYKVEWAFNSNVIVHFYLN